MFLCPVCKIDFKDDKRSYQRHFGFLNAGETRHQEIKARQEKIAIELFNTDYSGDTFHILKTHQEISLISEKYLRKLWKDAYGSEAIEKRRAKISFEKRNENDYEPARQKKIIENPSKCEFCDYRYKDEKSYLHHLGSMSDSVHNEFLKQQEALIIEIYKTDTDDGYEFFPKKYPALKFGAGFIYTTIKNNFSKQEIKDHKYLIKSKKFMGNTPWNTGLTIVDDIRIADISDRKSQEWLDGKYANVTGKAQSSRMKIVRAEHPEIAKAHSRYLINGYADGSIKLRHAKGGFKQDIGMYVRSSWEHNFVKVLNHLSIKFEYEADTFPLYENGELWGTYTPDFKCKGRYYEVKGVISSAKNWGYVHPAWHKGLKKITLFKQQYPHIKLTVIGKREYNRIMSKFGSIL